MIEDPRPRYKIKYMECQREKLHEGEYLNLVCLHDSCRDDSLICSMCKSDKHKGHLTSPLKFYLEQLKKDYDQSSRDYGVEMESLEQTKAKFFFKLKETVEKVAEQFSKLEQEVMQKFEQLQKQIIEEQTRKNKFQDFYKALSGQNNDQSINFLIRDYLPKKQTKIISDLSGLQRIGTQFTKEIYTLRQQLLSNEVQAQQKVDFKDFIKLPKTITCKDNTYTQSNYANGIQSIGLLDLNLLKQFEKTRIKIKVKKLKKATVVFGAITKQLYELLKMKPPVQWNSATYKNRLFYCNNQGVAFGHSKSQLKVFSEGTNLQIIVVEQNKMKILQKRNLAEYILPKQNNFYFFFSLQGNSEIEMQFLKK